MTNSNRKSILFFLVALSACNSKKPSPPCKGPCPITRPGAKTSTLVPNKSKELVPQHTSTSSPVSYVVPTVAQVTPIGAAPAARVAQGVRWLGSTVVEIRRSDILVHGRKASVSYTLNLAEDDHGVPGGVELTLEYTGDFKITGHRVTISDKNHDNKAESIDGWGLSRTVFAYSRNQQGARQIFTKADALLKRFRKEFEVDDLVKIGPPSEGLLFDPFPVK